MLVKTQCHKYTCISEKICSEGCGATCQVSKVLGPALGARMQCNDAISKVLDLACKSGLGFAGARVTVDPNQEPAWQNLL